MSIRTLTGVSRETLYRAFLDAFSDYAVDMQMPLAHFSAMLDGNGFDPSVSAGAFAGDRLTGFILCARRQYGGRCTLYDCGTSVVPAYRKQGLGAAMLTALTGRQLAQRFVLEVLQDNAAATALYERQGFTRLRELICYRCEAKAVSADASMQVTLLDALPDVLLAQITGLWTYPPTWQNSTASLLCASHQTAYAVIADGPLLLGYAAVNRANGALSQIAVHPDYRRLGIGSTLVYAASTVLSGRRMHAINVDARDAALQAALHAWGFAEYARQYEMERAL